MLVFVFSDKVSLYSPGCPGICPIDQACLKLRDDCTSTSLVLGLKACDSPDVGFPFVCCEYHWLMKKLPWPVDRAEFRKLRKTKLNAGRKKVESERSHGASSRDRETLLVSHDLVVIHRF